MHFTISPNRQILSLRVDASEQHQLKVAKSLLDRQYITDFMAPLVCETDLKWIKPEFIDGQFKGRTMFGIFGPESTEPKGEVQGRWKDNQGISRAWFRPVAEFWIWSGRLTLLEQLRDTGQATLIAPGVIERNEAEGEELGTQQCSCRVNTGVLDAGADHTR